MKRYSEYIILALILLLAGILRFYHYADWSLTNDELSAITRLRAGSFHELITNGVRPDFHPAGVQVFLYYWTKIFGNDVGVVRLPFVLCGILSVLYSYLVVKKWFNTTAAQLSALMLACLTYPILYSQLARPYSPGLLFVLMMVYHWHALIFENASKIKHAIAYALAMTLCMYTHYFCFVFAIIAGATGLFFVRKEMFKYYLGAAFTSVILFLPHLGITLEQFSRGGIGTWLGKPDSDFLRNYLSYAFDDSAKLIIFISGISILSALYYAREIQFSKWRVISLAWFFVPFIFGYYYSFYRNPILQYSVLLFSFPFLLVFLNSFYSTLSLRASLPILGILTCAMLWSGIKEQKFYAQKPFGVFKELCEKKMEWDKKYGGKKEWDQRYRSKTITTIFNGISPEYFNYYLEKFPEEFKYNFEFLRGDDERFRANVSEILDNISRPDSGETKYLIYGWSNNACPPEVYELIKHRFPIIVEDHAYFNSRITLFSTGNYNSRKQFLYMSDDFRHPSSFWKFSDSQIDTSGTYHLREGEEFSEGLNERLIDLSKDSLKYVNAFAYISQKDTGSDVHLVIEFHRQGNDTLYSWYSVKNKNCDRQNYGWFSDLFLTEKVPASYQPGDRIRVYLWNPGKKEINLFRIGISSFADMDYEPKLELK
ncbi:MAG TPA: glycosyltransferase family 39 protein [Bacteroidia bacterium]